MSLFGRGNKHSSEDERKAREEFWQRYNSVLGLPKVDEQAETYYNGQLIVARAHLTQICHPNGGSPKQVAATYSQIMQELMDWINIVPLRERLEGVVEETISSRWAIKEQPVEPLYTPELKRKRGREDSTAG